MPNSGLYSGCVERVALFDSHDAGRCLGYFEAYIAQNQGYWDSDRYGYSSKLRRFWDQIFPCRLESGSELKLIQRYVDLLLKRPELEGEYALPSIALTYKDQC